MRDPQPGSAREAVCRALVGMTGAATVQEIANAVASEHEYGAVQQAIQASWKNGDIVREGEARPYRYRLRTGGVASAVPPPVAEATRGADIAPPLAPGFGTRCGMPAPENRSQGTIEEALRAVLSADAPLSIDEVFLALPIGWSRAEALQALKEGCMDGWVGLSKEGWHLLGEPPAPRGVDPTRIVDPVSHAQVRLQEIHGGLSELLRDALRLQDSPPFIRSLANAFAEVDSALGQLRS